MLTRQRSAQYRRLSVAAALDTSRTFPCHEHHPLNHAHIRTHTRSAREKRLMDAKLKATKTLGAADGDDGDGDMAAWVEKNRRLEQQRREEAAAKAAAAADKAAAARNKRKKRVSSVGLGRVRLWGAWEQGVWHGGVGCGLVCWGAAAWETCAGRSCACWAMCAHAHPPRSTACALRLPHCITTAAAMTTCRRHAGR